MCSCSLLPKSKPESVPQTNPAVESARSALPQPSPAPVTKTKKSPWWDFLFFWKKKPGPEIPEARSPTLAGKIYLLNETARIAVVEAPSSAKILDGQLLACITEGRVTATLRATSDRKPPFFVADFETGVPRVGDRVVLLDASDPAQPAIPGEPSMEETSPDQLPELPELPEVPEVPLPGEELPAT